MDEMPLYEMPLLLDALSYKDRNVLEAIRLSATVGALPYSKHTLTPLDLWAYPYEQEPSKEQDTPSYEEIIEQSKEILKQWQTQL